MDKACREISEEVCPPDKLLRQGEICAKMFRAIFLEQRDAKSCFHLSTQCLTSDNWKAIGQCEIIFIEI